MTGLLSPLPADGNLRLTRARVPACVLPAAALPGPVDHEGLVDADIAIAAGRIQALAPSGSFAGQGAVDLGRGQVWPAFADLHTHLDKGHIVNRVQSPDGTLGGAIKVATADRANWSPDDLRRRFEFGLRCAYAHGSFAVRTHIDSAAPQAAISWPVMAELREAWAGRVELQAVAMAPLEGYLGDAGKAFAAMIASHRGLLGGNTRIADDIGHVRLTAALDAIFTLARAHDLDIDLHVDESGDPEATTLAEVAKATLRHGYAGRVTCGHVCSLAVQSEAVVRTTLALCAQAGLQIVSLPMCNMYLQGRLPQQTPRWRGVTLVHEIAAHGIPLSIASDNCRDPFYAFGDHDMLEVFTQAVRIAQLDLPYGNWPKACCATPSAVMGMTDRGRIHVGGLADLVLFRGRTMSELLSRPQADRVVLRGGKAISTALPDYRELDEMALAGAA